MFKPSPPLQPPPPPSRHPWAFLLRRVFAIDIMTCPECGGAMRVKSIAKEASEIRGGGADPASTQISLAQDVRLARDTFVHLGADPSVLFGSGDGSLVQRSTGVAPSSLREELADFFDPRDRAVSYESFDVRAAGPADADMVLSLITSLPPRPDPRFFFLAGHGERGDEPWDAIIRLWGDVPLSVPEFAEALGEAPTRVVITSCFGGGFASLFLRDGHPPEGDVSASDVMPNRCGFFASTWDREASGCDPNPERAQQQGYAMHFLHALEGQGREGEELDVDFDDDGQVTMLEAHSSAYRGPLLRCPLNDVGAFPSNGCRQARPWRARSGRGRSEQDHGRLGRHE